MNQEPTQLGQVVTLALELSPLDQMRLVQQVIARFERDLASQEKRKPKRTLEGLWPDVQVTVDDLADARSELWGGLSSEGDV